MVPSDLRLLYTIYAADHKRRLAKVAAARNRGQMMKRKIPELLSPAGGMQQLAAAIQNGADAVYMGGAAFNARMKADNFTDEDMRRAIDYAHERDVRIYVTLNTLVRDDELERVLSYMEFLYSEGADAIIVQDAGVGRMAMKCFSDMPVHLSTQATVYNRQGAAFAKRAGYTRIVPARELSLREIAEISKECHYGEKTCEVEIFVHGAQCMCYSGQCQMSRVIGGINGRSGNRGLCAQPCRLAYSGDRGRKGYLLSPSDMCHIDDIARLCEAGADSFKIEGRMKSAQYVAVVTSIYRKYLDMYEAGEDMHVSAEDRRRLTQIFSRGSFAGGYLDGYPGRKLLSGDTPKNTGIYIGKVMRTSGVYVDIDAEEEISKGDGIEIRGKRTSGMPAGNVVTYISQNGDGTIRVGDIKQKVYAGDSVFRVTDAGLLKATAETYESGEKRKAVLDMAFRLREGERPVLEVTERSSGVKAMVRCGNEAERARAKAADGERIRVQLAKLGGTPFEAGDIYVETDGRAALRISDVNDMRRRAVSDILERKRERYKRKDREGSRRKEDLLGETVSGGAERYTEEKLRGKQLIRFYRPESVRTALEEMRAGRRLSGRYAEIEGSGDERRAFIPLEVFMEEKGTIEGYCAARRGKGEDLTVMPYIFSVSRGRLDRYIEENFDSIKEAARDGMMVCNVGWAEEFLRAGLRVYGGHELNVYNMQAVLAFEEAGIEVTGLSYEASGDSGSIPLMVMEYDPGTHGLTDRKGAGYDVFRWYSGDKTVLMERIAKKKK